MRFFWSKDKKEEKKPLITVDEMLRLQRTWKSLSADELISMKDYYHPLSYAFHHIEKEISWRLQGGK